MTRTLLALALLAAAAVPGCGGSVADRAPSTWYDSCEVVCRVPSCGACRGSSQVGCGPCRASGEVPCDSCRDGKQRCGTCKGDGRKDGKPCKSCGGSGQTTCGRCGGDRMMTCGRCDGLKFLMCLRAMRISEPMPAPEDQWPPAVPK